MSLSHFSKREFRARPTRVFLTFLSIAIGVAAVVAVLIATQTTRSAQNEMLKTVSGSADLEILANDSQGFPYSEFQGIREHASVDVAIPSLNRFTTLFFGERKVRTQVLGIDPRIDQQIRNYEIVEGVQPKRLNEVLLDRSLARSIEVNLGDSIKLLGRRGLEQFELVGLVQPQGTEVASLSGALYMVLPSAQQLFRAGQNIDQVLVLVQSEFDVDTVAQQLGTALGQAVTVRQPRTSSDMAQETMYATENGLHMAIAFALLIAVFIIYNTFQMAVGERRKQLGILRAIGATRGQIERMILKEAGVIGLIGALAGCVLGYLGAGFLNSATEQILMVDLPTPTLKIWPFVAAVAMGMLIALLGAMLPARRASSVQPVEAMRAVEIRHNDEVIRYTRPIGLIAMPIGMGILWMAISGRLPVGSDVFAIVLILLGCVFLIPSCLAIASALVSGLLEPWMGVEAKLAQRQVMRHVGRSTLTIGVLFIAISACTGMAGNIFDNVDNVRAWYARTIVGDFFVRASAPDFATGAAADLPEGIETQLAAIDGMDSIEPMRLVNAQSEEGSVLVVSRRYDGNSSDYFDLIETGNTNVITALNAGQVVVGSVLAERRDLKAGDMFPLETQDGPVRLKIAGVANDYIAGGQTVYLASEYAAKLLGADGASVFIVSAKQGQLQHVGEQLEKVCQANGLILQSSGELVEFIDRMINGVIACLWMLLAIGCLIAAMGLVNTLTMNILEQTREIGMLRVVAMTRGQVRRMVFAQATVLGLLGLLPGALAGVFVAYAISRSALAVLGHNIVYQFRPALVLGCLAFGILVVLVASLIPAERAARLKLTSALQYE